VVRSDRNGVIAYDISTPTLAANPAWLTELVSPATDEVASILTLADGRLAVIGRADGSDETNHLQIYSFDGASFTLDEDITTTQSRIYDVIYDPATDRLFWTNYDATDSIRYYSLGSTPLPYTGFSDGGWKVASDGMAEN